MCACTNALACMDVVCARACFARVTHGVDANVRGSRKCLRADAPCPQFDNELPERVLALRRRASRGGVRAHSAHMRARHACAHDQHAQSITSTRTGQQFHKQADTHAQPTHELINPYERVSAQVDPHHNACTHQPI